MYLGTTTCKITIAGKYVLRGVNSIEIKRSVHQVIQTAKVVLPLSVVMRNDQLQTRIKLVDKIKEGDNIKLEFGYDGVHRTEFEGYIRRMNDSLPLELECEDELYLMRNVRLKESFKTISLRKLAALVLSRYNEQYGTNVVLYAGVPEMELSKYQINDASGLDVLTDLKEKHLMCSYLTTVNGVKTLYVGLAYSLQKGVVKYALARNTIGKGDLKYAGSDTSRHKVVVVNKRRDGIIHKLFYDGTDFSTTDAAKVKGKKQKPETVAGDETKIELPGDLSDGYLKQLAKSAWLKSSTKGYKGGFETFLFPFSEPGTVALLSDPQFTGRGGRYFVGTVTTTFGVSGGRRKNEIDLKVSV